MSLVSRRSRAGGGLVGSGGAVPARRAFGRVGSAKYFLQTGCKRCSLQLFYHLASQFH